MEEKKRHTTTSAQVKNRYNAKAYDRLSLVLRRDGSAGCTKEDIQAAAADIGESVNEYILKAVVQRMARQSSK